MRLRAITIKTGMRVKLSASLAARDSIIAECLTDEDGNRLVGTVKEVRMSSPQPIAVWFDGIDRWGDVAGWFFFDDDSQLEVVG